MMVITDTAAIRRLRALDEALTRASAIVHSITAEHRQATVRRETIAASIAEHETRRPEPDATVADELSDALAENPEAARSADWIGRVRDLQATHGAAVDAWQAEHSILAHADAKLGRQIDEIDERLAIAREAHEDAYRDFLCEAHDAIVAEFEARWGRIATELLEPLAAIKRAPKLHSAELHQLGFRREIHPDGQLSMQWPDAEVPGLGRGAKRLFPVAARHQDTGPIDAFRAAIGSVARTQTRRSASPIAADG